MSHRIITCLAVAALIGSAACSRQDRERKKTSSIWCQDGSRCDSYDYYTLGMAGGSTKYRVFWVRPTGKSDYDVRNEVPVILQHGTGLNDGHHDILRAAEALADQTGRPFIVPLNMTGGRQSSIREVHAHGTIWGNAYIDNVLISGAHPRGFTYDAHYSGTHYPLRQSCFIWCTQSCPWGGDVVIGQDGYPRCVDCGSGVWERDVINTNGKLTAQCTSRFRMTSNAWASAAGSLVLAVDKIISKKAYVTSSTKFDVVAHSNGGNYVAFAIANANNVSHSSFINFHTKIRGVVTVQSPFLGVVDGGAVGDAYEDRRSVREAFINEYKYHPNFDAIHWWALTSKSVRANNTNSYSGNYLGKLGEYQAGMNIVGAEWCGSDGAVGDSVVPTNSQHSPWRNSHGSSYTKCGRSVKRWYLKVGPTGKPKEGDHSWYLTSSTGRAKVSDALGAVCSQFGC